MSGEPSNSRAQEALVKLYLRLNGYFTTGLIIHAPTGVGSELDLIGVRFPFHDQRERKIVKCEKLKIPEEGIDIVIAEVKNSQIAFNRPLGRDHSRVVENWSQLLRWVGIWKQDDLDGLIHQGIESVSNPVEGRVGGFRAIKANSPFGKVSIRPIIFSIEKSHVDPSIEDFINGEKVIEFIRSCLDPTSERPQCAVGYNYTLWGEEFEAIIRLFKESDSIPDLESIYNLFNNSTQ